MFVGGVFDILASAADMRTAAERIPGGRYVGLWGSHFVQMEHPADVHQRLRDFLRGLDT
jgi:pimeloyl-ACP methyl ester carboxylesterase